MCVLREEGQPCAQEEGDVRGGDLSKAVQALEGTHLHLLRGQRRSDREREERDEGFGDHETSESSASRRSQQTGDHDRDG